MINLCSVNNCDFPAKVSGLCSSHYARKRRTGKINPTVPVRRFTTRNPICLVDECELPTSALGYCGRHYVRYKKYGDPLLGKDSKTFLSGRRKTGTGHLDINGYIQIYKPEHPNSGLNGIILEHRFIMSEFLGRPLIKGETVHHKNGQRNDNRIENLELWSDNHPKSMRVSDLVEWAKEIINLYE